MIMATSKNTGKAIELLPLSEKMLFTSLIRREESGDLGESETVATERVSALNVCLETGDSPTGEAPGVSGGPKVPIEVTYT